MLQSCSLRDGGTANNSENFERLLKGNMTHNCSYPSHYYLRTGTRYDVININI
jgi:hypothetical protein